MIGCHSTSAYKLYGKNEEVVFNKDVKFDEARSQHRERETSNKNENERQFYFYKPEENDQNEADNEIEIFN